MALPDLERATTEELVKVAQEEVCSYSHATRRMTELPTDTAMRVPGVVRRGSSGRR